jgi:hypothetical protein
VNRVVVVTGFFELYARLTVDGVAPERETVTTSKGKPGRVLKLSAPGLGEKVALASRKLT